MRCFINAASARRGRSSTPSAMFSGSAVFACLLLLAGLSDAFRISSPHERAQERAEWLSRLEDSRRLADAVLPPQVPINNGHIPVAPDLDERVFVGEMTLRHIYHRGTHQYPKLHRYQDIAPGDELRVSYDDGETYEAAPQSLRVNVMPTSIQRLTNRKPADIDQLLAYADMHGNAATLPYYDWTVDSVAGPNITNKGTVLTFAKMAANAYVQGHAGGEWKDVKGGFNYTDDFGWQADGLRGHIFADQKNKTIVIGLKGTSVPWFDNPATTDTDLLNDNLFGSCCCGQGGQIMWKQVCDCMTSAYTCNSTCLVKSLREKGHYYRAVRELYHNVTERYPNSDVWLSGHSLGGVVSSLLGLTYGLPTLTFEAFPDSLAASRLGLPTPPGYRIGSHQSRVSTGIYHFGHTADPIYMGTCNAGSSWCTIGGYAFQGVCHTGHTCIYDTVGDLGWRVGIGTHKISNVIRDVLEKYDTVPGCQQDLDCQDCFNWKFYESNSSEPITTSSSSTSSTRTRTEICKTPGWWGCLDETTTTTTATTSTTSSSSTSTCKTPGWFGCKDPTTTPSSSSTTGTTTSAIPAPSITTTSSLPTSTETCETPGWFGCRDPTTVAVAPSSTFAHTTPAPTAARPSPSSLPSTKRKECAERHWYGFCRSWEYEEAVSKTEL
ncbi:hypothetical protein BAUCODRAFT_142440 [Baudoinia panamericana UAMH 10762]|uniref:triacylglycerol lipase n=1 Tax=Baudoinia panamericana (strain UAMH 10762) TaxID=717646 RepID=M2MN78_BAUPA|nr:uncharacterized protein BAUCODRAFT_142440 [Baudoinia panamericana UAMH 10762]EMC92898.1 hypothetical protein BAUCODRAFT_142440 [Baudoinia panamericana UAMH 10762]